MKYNMAVLYVNGGNIDSMSPKLRIGKLIAEELKIPFIHDKETAKVFYDEYDVLFVLHGILLFSGYRDICLNLYSKAKKIISLQNDYTFKPDSRMSKNPNDIQWTTLKDSLNDGDKFINLNRCTWFEAGPSTLKNAGIIYHGSYRPDRVMKFRKYFDTDLYPVSVSTFGKNKVLFRSINSNITVYSQYKHPIQINNWQATLMLEDETSHELYVCPPNRFYEMLALGTPMLFEKSSVKMFARYGYDISKFTVSSPEDVAAILNNKRKLKNIQKTQRELWYRDYIKEFRKDVRRLAKEYI